MLLLPPGKLRLFPSSQNSREGCVCWRTWSAPLEKTTVEFFSNGVYAIPSPPIQTAFSLVELFGSPDAPLGRAFPLSTPARFSFPRGSSQYFLLGLSRRRLQFQRLDESPEFFATSKSPLHASKPGTSLAGFLAYHFFFALNSPGFTFRKITIGRARSGPSLSFFFFSFFHLFYVGFPFSACAHSPSPLVVNIL